MSSITPGWVVVKRSVIKPSTGTAAGTTPRRKVPLNAWWRPARSPRRLS